MSSGSDVSSSSGCAGEHCIVLPIPGSSRAGRKDASLLAMLEPVLLYSLTKRWYSFVRLPSV